MTRDEAEKVADEMRDTGWPEVRVQVDDSGRWSAIAEDPNTEGGWLIRWEPIKH